MRTYFIWGFLGVIGASVLGCSAGGKGSKATGGGDQPGAGGNSTTGGKGGGLGGLNGPGLGDVGGMTGADVVDPDPSNPNITHPKCNPGTCADFPAEAIIGAGVPMIQGLFGGYTSGTCGFGNFWPEGTEELTIECATPSGWGPVYGIAVVVVWAGALWQAVRMVAAGIGNREAG